LGSTRKCKKLGGFEEFKKFVYVNYFNDFILTAMVYDEGEGIGVACGFQREATRLTLAFEQPVDEVEIIDILIKLYPPAP